MLKSYENSGDRAGSLKLFKFLSMVFSALSSCIWSIQSLRDRLIYLRMAKAFCRRLPAAADQLSPGAPKTLTKKSFLLRLGVQGNARELTNELEQKDRAWNSWMACLKDSANSAHSKFDWLANEAEIILELAAAFFSEVTDGGLMKKWKVFDRAATESPLAKSLKDRPAVQKLRCKFYSNEVKKSKAFSPKLLLRLLKDGMETFSDEIYFVKKFIELSHHFDAVVYLKINPGISWLQRRIRCSALLVLGLKKYAQEGQNPARILQEVISIAVREENKLVLPDAYLWCWLLSHDAVKKSARGMEEAFALAREHCPWSKQLILESIKTRGLFKEILPETAKMFYSSGLQIKTHPDVAGSEQADGIAEVL
uniref:Uncharacterized protein n=1 Tax=Ditylenchus dipsaci TaxID=166011 RepID=A0A915EQF0_9BILA